MVESDPEVKNSKPVVRIADVQRASRESFNAALVLAVSFSTPYEALLLTALASLGRSTGRETGGFDIKEIMTKVEAMSSMVDDPLYYPPPSFRETLDILTRLGAVRHDDLFNILAFLPLIKS